MPVLNSVLFQCIRASVLVFGLLTLIDHPGLAIANDSLEVASSRPANSRSNTTVSVAGTNGRFFGQVIVNGTPETTWAVLTDYNNFPSFFPNIEQSRILRQSGNEVVFEQVNVVRVLALARRNRVVISAQQNHPEQISFRAIDGDIRSLQGVWRIIRRPGNQVLITHQVTVEPFDSNLRGIFFNIYRNELRNTLVALKQEIERRGSR